MKRDEPFIFKHMSKIITGFMVIWAICFVGFVMGMFILASGIEDQGLKNVLESVWCGNGGCND